MIEETVWVDKVLSADEVKPGMLLSLSDWTYSVDKVDENDFGQIVIRFVVRRKASALIVPPDMIVKVYVPA